MRLRVTTDKENIFDLVYQIVHMIPRGKVTTYGAIAACIGLKSGARMVGYAMGSAHSVRGLPAHRVVNSTGMLTGKHHFGEPGRMQALLEAEGLEIKGDRVQDFKKFFWDPAQAIEL